MLERGNFEANKEFLKRYGGKLRGKKVLEIGCGNGSMTNFLSSLGCDVVAIDLNETYLKTARKRFPHLKFRNMSGDDLKFEDNTFDIVVSFDLLEHIPEVKSHVFEVKRVLKSNGEYLLQTPNKLTSAIFSIYKDRSFTKWKSYHPSLQSNKSISKLFNDFDLKFCDVDYFTDWYRNKLPKILRNINPKKFGVETNIYLQAKKT
jgi:2-polyprenyl-3-methyl-5-hydroxy-6-metoxy-1,4-benzoquinol methylase